MWSSLALAATLALSAATGPTWHPEPTPRLTGGHPGALEAVSCWAANGCVALGEGETGGMFSETWDGVRWSGPAVLRGFTTALPYQDLSCPAPGECFTAGASGSRLAVDELRQGRWTLDPLGVSGTLDGVACRGSDACLAVGLGSSSAGDSVVERWDGSRWEAAAAPTTSGKVALDGPLSCPSPTTCFAAGLASTTNSTGLHIGLVVARWADGAWSVMSLPASFDGAFTLLTGIKCPTSHECVTVGMSLAVAASGLGGGVVYVWSHGQWRESAEPAPAYGSADLVGLACPSAASCTAVGETSTTTRTSVLVRSWNGSSWKPVAAPGIGANSELAGVACAGGSCQAVGLTADSLKGNTKGAEPIAEAT